MRVRPLRRLRPVLGALLLTLSSCGDAGSTTDGPPTLEVSETPVTVRDADLLEVLDVRTDDAGNAWVLAPDEPLVRVYDAGGERVAAFGRPGGGPTEFGFASTLVAAGEGEMGVMDSSRGRLRRYAPDGTLRSERALEGTPSLPREIRKVFFGDLGWTWAVEGGLLQDRYPPPPDRGPMPMQQAHDFWAGELVFLPEGEGEPRTLLSFAEFAEFDPEAPRSPNPLAAGPLWDLCPDGEEFVFHTGAASEVARVGMDGEVRSRSPVDLPLPPTEAETVTEWMVSVMGGVQSMPGDTPEALRERIVAMVELAEPGFEPELPPTRLRCDPEGRAWIQLFDLEDDQRGHAREWIVLERGGEVRAYVTFPPGFHPWRFEGERVVGVLRDERDVETVGWLPAPTLP